MLQKLDILAFGAHPDDIELGCAGTLYKHAKMGLKIGLIDLTLGEMGTRGNVETRKLEAQKAKDILNLSVRQNLQLPDGFIDQSIDQKLVVIKAIRTFQPEIIIINAPSDRHPDHGNAHKLVEESAFLSGLAKIETKFTDETHQPAWRPKAVFSYIQDRLLNPDFIVNISDEFETKKKAILAHESQFYNSKSAEPQTYISSPNFLKHIEARDLEFGRMIGVTYGEGFIASKKLSVNNLLNIIPEIF